MNKKQAGIILTLLALIICTGILAAKVNNNLDTVGPTDLGGLNGLKGTISESKNDYFTYARAEKDQNDTRTIETLKGIIENQNTSKENKDKATEEYTKLTTNQKYETSIELSLRGKGYEDVLCFIENNQARVYIKTKEKLTAKQVAQIQEVITSISQIREVIIEEKE